MSKKEVKAVTKRRSFLKGAAITTAAVGSGAITANTLAEDVTAEDKKPQKVGYQETDHVRAYYRLARF